MAKDSDYSLDDLAKQAKEGRAYLSKYMKEGYQLAKDLGFTASEASVLKGKNRETIRRLAAERAGK